MSLSRKLTLPADFLLCGFVVLARERDAGSLVGDGRVQHASCF